jgi:hypothetical protein
MHAPFYACQIFACYHGLHLELVLTGRGTLPDPPSTTQDCLCTFLLVVTLKRIQRSLCHDFCIVASAIMMCVILSCFSSYICWNLKGKLECRLWWVWSGISHQFFRSWSPISLWEGLIIRHGLSPAHPCTCIWQLRRREQCAVRHPSAGTFQWLRTAKHTWFAGTGFFWG